MAESPKTFYITTPIYYVNARPHIGHAYTTLAADVLARRHRLLGEDTFFLTGTDEHGQKIERSAAAAGIAPQQFADGVSASFESLWKRMGITNNRYIRTTDAVHKAGVQKLFSTLYERGFIELKAYTGQYCVSEEMFVEGPPGTIGPDGKPTETVTEENFFFRLSEFQRPLLDVIESGRLVVEPEARRNEVLSFLRGNVAAASDVSPDTGIQPDAKYGATAPEHQVRGLDEGSSEAGAGGPLRRYSDLGHAYVPGALKDLSVSRSSFTWGVPVPEPAASTAAQKHVVYVWLDALANYMTAIGYGAATAEAEAEFLRYWPADLHLVGKEIIRFHCVYWPAFLLAAGLPLPRAITAHGWLLFDNAKMSKSKGNIVRTETILDAFGDEVYGKQFPASTRTERDLFASDVLRYFLLREVPFGQDGSFSFDALITRYNADLANGYGNLVSRTLSMIGKYFDGVIPQPVYDPAVPELPVPDGLEAPVLGVAAIQLQARLQALPETDFSAALTEIAAYMTTVDGFITSAAPWKLAKDETKQGRLATVLYLAAEAVRWLTGALHTYCPATTAKVWTSLGLGDISEAAADGELAHMHWAGLEPGTKLGAVEPLFPRAEKGLADTMADMENPAPPSVPEPSEQSRPEATLKSALTPAPATPVPLDSTSPAAPPRSLDEPSGLLPVAGSAALSTGPTLATSHTDAAPSGIFASAASQTPVSAGPADASPQIAIDDFAKVELRVAEIKVAERIPKADKLLRLEVDLGYERRQILSGIAEWYTPEDLIGRRIVVITNLAPRKMRGLESHGMLLAASDGDGGKPVLATFGEEIALGSRLK